MAPWFRGMCAPSYVQLGSVQLLPLLSLFFSRSLIYINEILGFLLQYICNSSLFRTGKLHGIFVSHSVVYSWTWIGVDLQMSVFILCFKGLPEHSASPPLPAKHLTQLCKLSKLLEPLNEFILVSVHPGTCQYGDGKKNRLWMCQILSV